jgi:hypothetical protein
LIWRYGSGGWVLLTWGTSGAINGGTATNRLKVERNGSLIKAYANDQLLTIVSDGSYTGSRRLGLIATSYAEPNVDIRFDNFKVYPLSCGGITGLSSETSQIPSGLSATTDQVGNSNHASAQVAGKAGDLPHLNTRPGALPTEVD